MKRNIRFMPLKMKNKRNIFFINFINDLKDALIGFFIGAAIEAVFELKLIKAIIFIIIYVICSFLLKRFDKKDKKDISNKIYRGIKIKSKYKKVLGGGLVIISIFVINQMKFPLLFALIHLLWKTIDIKSYYFQKKNLIYMNQNL